MVVLLALMLALIPGAAHAQGISLKSPMTIEKSLSPGGTVEGTLDLLNMTDAPQQARVYQTDLTPLPKGAVDFGEPGKAPRSNAGWLVVTPQQFTIPAGSTAQVNYLIRVPADDTLKGTYWSVIMVEGIAPAALEPPKQTDKALFAMNTVMRYAIQMITNIGDSGTRDLKFVDRRIATVEGKRTLQLDLGNDGERWLHPTLWAELYDAQGASKGRFEGGRARVYPGDMSQTCSFDLSGLAAGKYTALIVADNGDEEVFGAQYDLELE